MAQMEEFEQRMKALLEEGMRHLYEEGKTDQEVGEWAAEAIIKATEGSAPAVVKSLLRDSPRMVREHRSFATDFDRRLRKDWGAGLDLMYAVIVSCGEAGEGFYLRQTLADSHVESLAGLHARAWRTATEAHVLLSHGFPAGAMARARTMHELAVVAFVISGFGREPGNEDLAERYLLHGSVMAHKEALTYQANVTALGYKPISNEELEQMRSTSEELVKRFGKGFGSTNGWASALVGVESPRFVDLEKLALLSHLRPYYSWASHSVHADSRGWAMNQFEHRGRTVMAAGATNVGLADPAQLAMIAFLQCTVSLISSAVGGPTSIMDQLAAHSILLLIDQANQELVKVEPKIIARESNLQRNPAEAE
jgi:hypothetical protein